MREREHHALFSFRDIFNPLYGNNKVSHMKGEVMYQVELTEDEIRAIISYYDNVMLYMDEVEKNFYGSYTISFDEERQRIKSRVKYLLNL